MTHLHVHEDDIKVPRLIPIRARALFAIDREQNLMPELLQPLLNDPTVHRVVLSNQHTHMIRRGRLNRLPRQRRVVLVIPVHRRDRSPFRTIGRHEHAVRDPDGPDGLALSLDGRFAGLRHVGTARRRQSLGQTVVSGRPSSDRTACRFQASRNRFPVASRPRMTRAPTAGRAAEAVRVVSGHHVWVRDGVDQPIRLALPTVL